MQIYSMTGYSRVEGDVGGARLTIEVKSVNHRYLDYRIKLPRELNSFEARLAEMIRQECARGRVEAFIDYASADRPVTVRWNEPLAREVLAALRQMRDELKLPGEPDLALMAAQRDVIVTGEQSAPGDKEGEELAALFLKALAGLKTMRAKEGANLAEDLKARMAQVEKWIGALEGKKAGVNAAIRERLNKRLQELLGPDSRLDPDRMATEVAMIVDRADITEELVRFASHLGQFRSVLAGEGPRGRKLDFLLQELFREINTSSNKSQDAGVSAIAVDIKTELEKIREQVQNLE